MMMKMKLVNMTPPSCWKQLRFRDAWQRLSITLIALLCCFEGAMAISIPKPTDLTVSEITATTAKLSWTENGNATVWQICLNGDETNLIDVDNNLYTLENLSASTNYSVKVRAVSGEEYSDWTSSVSFKTTPVAVAVGTAWSDDFEGTTCGWELINGTLTNAWAWGTATNNGGTHALYISKDGGTTHEYLNVATMVYAVKLLTFEEGIYEFSYDWIANGESNYDYLRVALVPGSTELAAGTVPDGFGTTILPTGWIALDGGSKLNLVNEWQSKIEVKDVSGTYYLVFAWRNDGSNDYLPPAAIDNVSIRKITCFANLENLAVSDLTTTSATLTWTNVENQQWQVAYSTSSNFANATTVIADGASYAITGLQPATDYYAKVRAYCGDEDYGVWSPVIQFTTECATITTFPWTENFNSLTEGNSIPKCWDNSDGTTTNDSYKWCYNTSTSGSGATNGTSHDGSKCVRFNSCMNSRGNTNFLKTPVLSLPADKQMQLSFWYKNPKGGDFSVYISTDGGVTYTTALATGLPNQAEWTEEEIQLIGYAGEENVVIVFKGTSNYANNDAYIYLDDVTVEEIPAYPRPTNLAVTLIPHDGTKATLSWQENGGATQWQICLNGNEDNPITANTNPFTLEGLTAETVNTVKVRAYHSETFQSRWSNSVSFEPTAKQIIGSGIATESVLPLRAESNYSLSQQIYTYEEVGGAGTINSIDFYCTTSNKSAVTRNIDIYMVYTDKNSFSGNNDWVNVTADDRVFSGNVTFAHNAWSTITLANPFNYDGEHNLLLVIDDNTSSYTVPMYFSVFTATRQATCAYGGQEYHKNYDPTAISSSDHCNSKDVKNQLRLGITPSSGSFCESPTTFTMTDLTATTATLAWTGGSETYQVKYKKTTDTDWTTAAENTTESSITLEGLAPNTDYEVRVRSVCSTTSFSGWRVLNFTTDCGEQSLPYSEGFEGDIPCWTLADCDNNTKILTNVKRNGSSSFRFYGTNTHAQYLISPELAETNYGVEVTFYYETFVSDCTDPFLVGYSTTTRESEAFTWDTEELYATTEWTEYNHIFPAETKYVAIKYAGNKNIYIDDFSFAAAASCPEPRNLAATEIGPNSVKLSWKERGEATAWQISLNGGDPVNVTENPYTLASLSPETDYTVKVRACCSETAQSDWSSSVGFTTLINNPTPLEVTVSDITATTATVSWRGYGDSYNVRYRTAAYVDGIVEQFDTALPTGWENKSGLLSEVMNGTDLTDGSHWYFSSYNGVFDDHARINIFGTSKKGWLVTPAVKIAADGALGFDLALTAYSGDNVPAPETTGTDDRFVVLVYADDTWTILREWKNSGSTYVYNNIANTAEGEKVSIDLSAYTGKSVRIAFYGESTVGNADNNLHIDNVTIGTAVAAGAWQTISDITAQTTSLTNLTPSTKYECQVQSVKSGSDNSEWSPLATFTTRDALTLADDDSGLDAESKNTARINAANGKQYDVTLNGRTLAAEKWNTLCLPFSMTAEQIAASPLKDAVIRTLKSCTIDATTLTIAFEDATAIEAGKPFIVRWANGSSNVSSPVFNGVTISNADPSIGVTQGDATFVGTYTPVTLTAGLQQLFMQGNALHNPSGDVTVNAFRGYFNLTQDVPTGGGSRIIIDFGDGEITAIDGIDNDNLNDNGNVNGNIYDLQGRRVNGSAKKGLYIENGRVIIIK